MVSTLSLLLTHYQLRTVWCKTAMATASVGGDSYACHVDFNFKKIYFLRDYPSKV